MSPFTRLVTPRFSLPQELLVVGDQVKMKRDVKRDTRSSSVHTLVTEVERILPAQDQQGGKRDGRVLEQ